MTERRFGIVKHCRWKDLIFNIRWLAGTRFSVGKPTSNPGPRPRDNERALRVFVTLWGRQPWPFCCGCGSGITTTYGVSVYVFMMKLHVLRLQKRKSYGN